jgi:integrase
MPRLTDTLLKGLRLELGQKDRLVFDTDCPGLGVRMTAKGTKTFLVQWTDPATKRKVREAIGVWGGITIEQARAATRVRLGEVAKGISPAAERKKRKDEADALRAEASLSLGVLIDQWAALHLTHRRPRYAAEATRAVRQAFSDHLKRPAAHLSRATAISVLDKMGQAGKATTAGRTMAYARACYAWAEKRGKVPSNPFSNLPVSASATERERALTEAEAREVWSAAGTLPFPFGPFYRIAVLTLQRREEVAGMRWSELSSDLTLWTIPGSRMKNGRPHDVHLTQAAREILKELPRFDGSDLVFTSRGATPVSGFSKAKRQLDEAIAAARDEAAEKVGGMAQAMEPWRLHDVRRTGVTRLAALGFDSIVVDKLLAHQPGKLKGVASVYQRHNFAKERAAALEAWAAHVTNEIVTKSNVIPLNRVG